MDLVLSLVVQQNRPFNSGNLADALQKDNVKKVQVQRYLDQLVTDGKIKMRECGKSKVYFAIQPEAVLSKEKITEMERSKIALEELLIEKKQEELKNKQMLQEQKKQISVKEIREQTVQLQRTNGELQKKLQPIKERLQNMSTSGNLKEALKTQKDLEKKLVEYSEIWFKRKRAFKDITLNILDAVPTMKHKDFMNQLEIDTDETYNVDQLEFRKIVDAVKKKAKAEEMNKLKRKASEQ